MLMAWLYVRVINFRIIIIIITIIIIFTQSFYPFVNHVHTISAYLAESLDIIHS